MSTLILLLFCYLLTIGNALAISTDNITYAAVGKDECSRVLHTSLPYILVLKSNEDLLESITQCVKDADLKSASISAIGQLFNPSLAYFSNDPKEKPTIITFKGFYELASLNGNVTKNREQYYTHLHGVLADQKFHGIAGHIDAAKIGLTVEVTIIPLPAIVSRTVNTKTGFGNIRINQ